MANRQFKAYLLHFRSPLHISDSRDDYGSSRSSLTSDGIYAALTSTLASLGREIPAGGDLGCTVSSLFPFCQAEDKQPTLFFPKPMSAKVPQVDDLSKLKLLKKVMWMDQHYFEQMFAGMPVLDGTDATSHICGRYMVSDTQGFDEGFVTSSVMQRVTIPDSEHREPPTPFYMDRIWFNGRSGLFFLCEGDTSLVDQAMPLLAQSGIGTDRNVGNGFFEYEKRTISLNLPESAEAAMCLSTYIPSSRDEFEAAMAFAGFAYELRRMGGWMMTADQQPLRRNVVHAFAEGSVFGWQGNIQGTIVNLAPDASPYPVYRCGRALMLPYKTATT